MNLRILSYNIHKCIGSIDRRYRPERVIEVIAHHAPDICFLQEVDSEVKRSKRHRQVEMLAEALGYGHYTWFPNVKVRGGGTYGNAILSRFPLHDSHNIDITLGRRKARSVLYSRQQLQLSDQEGQHSKTVHLFNMHLGLSQKERKIQLQKFLDCKPFFRLHSDTPIIVAGDLNDVYGNLGRKLLAPAGFSSAKLKATFPSYAPLRVLDGLYVRGQVQLAKLSRSRLKLARQASDHLPLIADIELG